MTNQARTIELRPIGRGTLHTEPTDLEARRQALRDWARSTKARPTPVDAATALARRASAPAR